MSCWNISMSTSSGLAFVCAGLQKKNRKLRKKPHTHNIGDVMHCCSEVAMSRYRAPASARVQPNPEVFQGDFFARKSQPHKVVIPGSECWHPKNSSLTQTIVAAEARLTAGEQEVTLPWCACNLCLSAMSWRYLNTQCSANLLQEPTNAS